MGVGTRMKLFWGGCAIVILIGRQSGDADRPLRRALACGRRSLRFRLFRDDLLLDLIVSRLRDDLP